jgi:deazaflavin-dependent oxidoreductase (nitroreductase family)
MPVQLTPRGTRGAGFPKMAPWMLAVFHFMNVGMFRLLGRRMRVQGRPLLLLTTTGAKTGRRRETTLGWFPDEERGGGSRLIVASKAGAATHPSWYVNLARRPDGAAIEVDGHRFAVNAESLHGAERDRAWKRIVALAPGYRKYEQQTDREIPVVRLTPKT